MNEKPLDRAGPALPAAPKVDRASLFQTWKKRPGPETMTPLLTSLQPVIDRALKTYGYADDPLMRSTAQLHAMKVLGNYDPSRGANVETFLTNEMRRIQRLGAQQRQAVKVPERVALDFHNLKQDEDELRSEFGRDPTANELADKAGLSKKRIEAVRKRYVPMKLTGAFQTEEGYEATPGTEHVDMEQLWLESVHGELGPIDQKIVEWSVGLYGAPVLEKTEMAKRLGISSAAVSQRSKRIADRVQEGSKFKVL